MNRSTPRAWIATEPEGGRPVTIWGLSPAERLTRSLVARGVTRADVTLGPVAPPADVRGLVALHGGYVLDDRLIQALLASPNTALLVDDGERRTRRCVAGHFDAQHAELAVRVLNGSEIDFRELRAAGVEPVAPHELVHGYSEKLRSIAPPIVLEVNAGSVPAIERRLFDASYKGVTDLVTKWVWPTPARWVTGWCVRRGITPNAVTSLSWVLAAVAGVLFYQGRFALGLAVGWVMTFLDTVDGKLARVTLTSTKRGDVFDHSLDLLHPPLWYLAWAIGVDPEGAWHSVALGVTVGGYVIGRLVEGLFMALWKTHIHNWRRIDSWFRTVTARRNPNMILLTLSLLVGRPDLGIVWVAVWTAISTTFHTVRFAQAGLESLRGRAVQPWMSARRQVGA